GEVDGSRAAAGRRLRRPDRGERELALEHAAAIASDAQVVVRRAGGAVLVERPAGEVGGLHRGGLSGLGDLVALVVLVEHRYVDPLAPYAHHVVKVAPVEVPVPA